MAFRKSYFAIGQEGQILLVVILTMIVALTVGLSIVARIVTELKLSKQNEESQRAFQAAESGIQQALLTDSIAIPVELGNNSSYTAIKSVDTGQSLILNNNQEVDQVTGTDVWLSDYSSDLSELFENPMGNGNPITVTLYWGTPSQSVCTTAAGDATAPAIEVVVLRDKSNPQILKNVFETRECFLDGADGRVTGAVSANASPIPVAVNTPKVGGPQFRNHVTLTFDDPFEDGLIMKIIPIYNSSIVGFQSTSTFPPQGATVVATGTSGDTVRKVTYFQSYPQLPIEIFPYSQISQ